MNLTSSIFAAFLVAYTYKVIVSLLLRGGI